MSDFNEFLKTLKDLKINNQETIYQLLCSFGTSTPLSSIETQTNYVFKKYQSTFKSSNENDTYILEKGQINAGFMLYFPIKGSGFTYASIQIIKKLIKLEIPFKIKFKNKVTCDNFIVYLSNSDNLKLLLQYIKETHLEKYSSLLTLPMRKYDIFSVDLINQFDYAKCLSFIIKDFIINNEPTIEALINYIETLEKTNINNHILDCLKHCNTNIASDDVKAVLEITPIELKKPEIPRAIDLNFNTTERAIFRTMNIPKIYDLGEKEIVFDFKDEFNKKRQIISNNLRTPKAIVFSKETAEKYKVFVNSYRKSVNF